MRWIALLPLAFALTLPAAASAKPKIKTVDAEIVVKNGNRPGEPGNCSAVGFVMWEDEPGTISATAYYTKRGEDLTETAEAPFHDTIQYVATYTVPAGHHWIAIPGGGHRSGSQPSDCKDIADKIRPQLGDDPFVELTVVESKECRRAKRKLAVSKRQIRRLERESANNPPQTFKGKTELKQDLKEARRRKAKNAKRVKNLC